MKAGVRESQQSISIRTVILDIYICRAGYPFEKVEKKSFVHVNNGDLTFTESAAEFGLDDPAHSTHAAFFRL